MKTTADFLDAMRAKLDLPSDGKLGVYLGIQRQHMSWYRTMKGTFDEQLCLKIADILETDPAYVIASMMHQREKNEAVKKVWERIANLSIGVAASLLVFALLPIEYLPNGDVGIVAMAADSGALYIMSNGWGILLALAFALVIALPSDPGKKKLRTILPRQR
jgi:hypothetical protein